MRTNKYTLSELLDLALRVPEVGAVNFNILHTVIKTIIERTNLETVRPLCSIENPAIASTQLSRAKVKPPKLKKSFSAESKRISDQPSTEEMICEDPAVLECVFHLLDGVEESLGERTEREESEQVSTEERRKSSRVAEEELEYESSSSSAAAASSSSSSEEPVDGKVSSAVGSEASSRHLAESWKETRVDRRIHAVEEGIYRLFEVTDRLVQHSNSLAGFANEIKKDVDEMKPVVFQTKDDVDPLADKIVDIEIEIEDLQKLKLDVSDFSNQLTETFESQKPEFIEIMEKKIDYLDDTVTQIFEQASAGSLGEKPLFDKHGTKFKGKPLDLLQIARPEVPVQEAILPSEEEVSGVGGEDTAEETEARRGKAREIPKKFTSHDLNQRFHDVWEELHRVNNLVSKLESEGGFLEDAPHVDRMLRRLNDGFDSITMKTDLLTTEGKIKAKAIELLQEYVDSLKLTKVDEKDMKKALTSKVDKEEMALKVSKEDFESTVEDVFASVKGISDKLVTLENRFDSYKDDIYGELKRKLYIEDYEALEKPVWNRIRSLMFGLSKLKTATFSSLYPHSSGVTKCICCGRVAELLGGNFIEGESNGIPSHHPQKNNWTVEDVKPCSSVSKGKPSDRSAFVELVADTLPPRKFNYLKNLPAPHQQQSSAVALKDKNVEKAGAREIRDTGSLPKSRVRKDSTSRASLDDWKKTHLPAVEHSRKHLGTDQITSQLKANAKFDGAVIVKQISSPASGFKEHSSSVTKQHLIAIPEHSGSASRARGAIQIPGRTGSVGKRKPS